MDVRYASFNLDSIQRAVNGKLPKPEILECHPSPHCQLDCSYCHSKWKKDNDVLVYSTSEELLSVCEYEKLLDSFRGLGGKMVVLSGGKEPTLYPDFLDLLALCKEKNFPPHLYSNGTTDIMCHQFLSIVKFVSSVRISIHYSAGAEKIMTILERIGEAIAVSEEFAKKIHLVIYSDILRFGEMAPIIIEKISSMDIIVELKGLLQINIEADHSDDKIEKIYSKFKELRTEKIYLRTKSTGRSPSCFSIYRTMVCDPFGNIHVCCMRANLSADDFGCIGNIRTNDIAELLKAYSSSKMSQCIINCISCAERDYEFNCNVYSFLERMK